MLDGNIKIWQVSVAWHEVFLVISKEQRHGNVRNTDIAVNTLFNPVPSVK
jgi:hypothetical protein